MKKQEKIITCMIDLKPGSFVDLLQYTCRKTLADKRPRIHGRFVRKWEQGEIPKATCFRPVGEGDELLVICFSCFSNYFNHLVHLNRSSRKL